MTDDNNSPFRRPMGHPPPPAALEYNKDLLLRFLILLPAKPLIRFKAVSKRWFSIVSDPEFRRAHAARHHNPIPITHHLNTAFSPPCYTFPYIEYHPWPLVKIWHSCNGLLLCSFASAYTYGQYLHLLDPRFPITDDNSITHHIYNPTTKESKILPCRFSTSRGYVLALNLAFNPAISPHYRVICIRGFISVSFHRRYWIEVYSPEANSWSWRSIGSFQPRYTVYFRFPVFFNGAIYWDSDGPTSLYYEVDTASLKAMPMPAPTLPFRTRYFGESRGHLHKIKVDHRLDLTFDIYEMREDHSGWDKYHHVCLSNIKGQLYWRWRVKFNLTGNCNAFSVFDLIREDNEDESMLVILVSGKVITCRLKDMACMEFGYLTNHLPTDLLPLATHYFSGFSAYRYIQTLACI